ncbi:MAG: MMPL family transporter [Nostocoides sp.]
MISHLTSRRGAWLTLVLGLLLALGVIGGLSGAKGSVGNDTAPAASESAHVAELAAQFPDNRVQSVLLVITRADRSPLTATDQTAAAALGSAVATAPGHPSSPPLTSRDGLAAMVQVPIETSVDNAENAATITSIRNLVHANAPADLKVQVTGGPAFGADIATAFDGANVTLLLVTVGIVALLLLLTYRSPVLWLVPLTVVALADQVAAVVTKALGSALDLQFDTGIVSVLVFGAGTNYALLLISRYREELRHTADHRSALAAAWRATTPAILASNATVVVGLATLALAVIPGTHGLGIASAVGVLVALAAVLLVLPAVLAMCGRRVFWPFVPRVGEEDRSRQSVWGRSATAVMRRPAAVVGAGLALLAVLASGLLGTHVGLAQTERFRVASESATGLEVLGEHFPAGAAQPLLVVTHADQVEQVRMSVAAVPGVTSAQPTDQRTTGATPQLVGVSVVLNAEPGTADARALVAAVRDAAHAVPGADALVGGQQATDVDARAGTSRDLWLIAPIILLVSALVLIALTRSLVAPVLLLGINALSALATIGAGAWIGRHLFDWPALDLQVPLLSFLFLVALGIDYTIFLVHRARAEARAHGTREGMVRAVAGTGGVITSAGIVLAAVFAALGVLPLVTLGQLGLIVGLGVVLDTFFVRTVLVPAVFGLLGDRIWWPSPAPRSGTPARDQVAPTAVASGVK